MAPVVRSTFLIGRSSLTGFFSSMASRQSSISFTVEHLVEAVVLPLGIVDGDLGRHLRLMEDAAEIEALGLPMVDRLALVEDLGLADHLGEGAEAERGHVFAHLLGDEEEIIDDVLGLALEARAQHRVLGGDADRAGVQMAFAHHDAAGGDQRRGGEAELVGAEQRADQHVAAGADAAVDLHGDAAAQAVQHQRLLGLGEADLPGGAGMLDRGQRRSAGAALEAGDGDVVGACALATPAATVPTPTSVTSLTDTSASGLTFFRSKISCVRSSIE